MIVGAGIGSAIGGNFGAIIMLLVYLLALAASPIVGVVYSVKRDIVNTYTDPELYDLLFSVHYVISVLKYFFVALAITMIYVFGSVLTLGLGALFLFPIFMYVRPCFWSHVYYNFFNESQNS